MLLHCSKCNSSCHPTCVGLSLDLINFVTGYEWECTDCKQCMTCQVSSLSNMVGLKLPLMTHFPTRTQQTRTRCFSVTSVTEATTSTALAYQLFLKVKRHHKLKYFYDLVFPGRWHCSECSKCESCGCKTPIGDGSVILDR